MKTFKILSFDGGGIKGALSARILKRICEKFPNLLDEVDLFAGTSTGSLIALSLAYGKTANFVDDLYSYSNTKKIFSPSQYNIFKPKYSNYNLSQLLLDYFPEDLLIKDLKKYVFVPSFNVKGFTKDSFEVVFFNNLCNNSTYNSRVIDVALSTSAAPTYFPSHNNFIDGGVVANSPTAAAVFSAMNCFSTLSSGNDFRLLSIGTGDSPDTIIGDTSKWGAAQWAFHPFAKMKSPFLSLVMDGSSYLEDIYCKEFLKTNYFRINPKVSKFIAMDKPQFVPFLKNLGTEVDLTETYKFIETIFLN
ncbi:patatin-like phospholipase family protein [Clostridium gasigenes]|uniref:patatin-like phospholipase family protein n=1 Tax=Clostridium gasigenes TaxID=94869 RepID=UPI0014385300|nr:patatin-like phospholipase family protein [Clostridium gasigenes]NKF06999.1 patatin [Clostridium gasigenes]QSW19745.1 patatin-like phospholipase family protein [Clostridium gasigenes]